MEGSTVPHEYLPAPKEHEALEKCKIANSLDDVFVAEGG